MSQFQTLQFSMTLDRWRCERERDQLYASCAASTVRTQNRAPRPPASVNTAPSESTLPFDRVQSPESLWRRGTAGDGNDYIVPGATGGGVMQRRAPPPGQHIYGRVSASGFKSGGFSLRLRCVR